MKAYTYLFIDLACLSIPLIASFYKKYPFYKEWKHFFPANFLVAFVFLIWDYKFTKMEIWGFNPDYLTGIYVLNLPIEEVLFFICIPYACVFTYFVCKKYIHPKRYRFLKNYPVYVLMLISFVVAILFWDKLYTFSTAVLLFCTLLFTWVKNVNINLVIIAYISIIPFFFLSNGILTGSLLEHPIVWYNNLENLNIRMFTIPIEDPFYGFLLILLNVLGYEKLVNHKVG